MAELDIKWVHLEMVLNEFADAVIQRSRDYLDQNDSNASHNLYDTMEKIIQIPSDENDNYFSVSISLADYWRYVENGRGPGRFPPIDKIKGWVEIKPVNIHPINGKTPTVEQVSFLIARKIANDGTEAHPFFKPAVDELLPVYEVEIERAIQDDVYDFINEAVIEQLNKTFGKK